MAFSLIQSQVANSGTSSGVSSQAITVTSTGAGHLLVAGVTCQNATGPATITPPTGWSQVGSTITLTNTTLALFYLANSTSGVTSFTFSASVSSRMAISFEEWSGVATTSPLDQQTSNSSTTTTTSVTTGSTAALAGSGELGIWFCGSNTSTAETYSSVLSSYVVDTSAETNTTNTSGNKAQGALFYNTSVGSAATSSGVTLGTASVYGAIIAAFKPSGVASPVLATSPTTMNFSASVGGSNPSSQSDTLSETNGVGTAWTSTISYGSGSGWLAISPTSGTLAANGTQSITVSCTTGALAVGTYTATVTFTATTGGATATISVSFTVGAAALSTSPTTMTFSAVVNGSNPSSQNDTLSETAGYATNWTSSIAYGSGSGWLSVSPSSGSLSANGNTTIAVSPVTGTLVSGTYTATITFTATSGGATATIAVTFTILSSSPISYASTIINDGAQAYYRFDESSGSAHDSSGNHFTATCTSITYSQAGAIANDSDTAFLFNGTSSQVTCPSGLSAVGWNKITVEAWVKLTNNTFGHKATIWATGTTPSNSGDGFDFWIGANGTNGGFAVGVSGDKWAQATFSQTFTAGTWYYVVGTWDGTTISVYVNGVLNGSTGTITGAIDSAGGNNITIGQDPQANSYYFPGTMDEAAIYAKSLSTSKVQYHYAVGVGQVASYTSSLTNTPGAVFLLINDVLYPTILQETINVERTAADPIPTFSFALQDDGSAVNLHELDDVVFLDAGQIPYPTHNLLSNPALNPYNTAWSYTSHSGVTASTNTGGGLLLAFSNASNGASVTLSQTTQAGMVVSGQQYMASVYVQGTSTPTNIYATLQLNLLNQSGTLVSSVNYVGSTPPSTTPTQYSLSVTVPTGIYYIQMQLIATTTSATNSGDILFTQAQLEPMTFARGKNYQLLYPTPWCASGQTNCLVLPDGTTVRQFRLFGGLITKATAGAHVGLNRQWAVTVSGYAWLLSKQILNDTYTNQADSTIINSIVSKYFSGVFSTANVASTNGFSNTLTYQYNGTARDALDALCTNSSYIAGCDAYWTLFYQPPGYNTLNFELSDTPNDITSFEYYAYARDTDATQIGNTIFVTGATPLAAIVIDAQSVATYANRLGNISGTFWRQINNSALNSTQACLDAGIGEASEYGYARPIVHLSTQQFMVPGYTVYLTSRTDGYYRTSFLIQKVTLKLTGFQSLGYAIYECSCDLGYFNPDIANILAAILRLQTSTTTGGTTPAAYYGPPPPVNPTIGLMATETVNFYDSIQVSVTSTTPIGGIPTAQYGTAQATYGSNLVGYQ